MKISIDGYYQINKESDDVETIEVTVMNQDPIIENEFIVLVINGVEYNLNRYELEISLDVLRKERDKER